MKKMILALALAATVAGTLNSCRGGRALPKPPGGGPPRPSEMQQAPAHRF